VDFPIKEVSLASFLELGLGLGDIEAACSPSRPATPSAINTQVQYPGERRGY
jgi:hypothetical protein